MSQPSWYPDPKDLEDQMRYWGGKMWRGAPKPWRSATTSDSPGRKDGWVIWVVSMTGVVVVVLLAWSVLGRGLQPATPTNTVSTEPTGNA